MTVKVEPIAEVGDEIFNMNNLGHWVGKIKNILGQQNLLILQSIECDQIIDIVKKTLIQASRDNEYDYFWERLSELPRLITVFTEISEVSKEELEREIENAMRDIVNEACSLYEIWIPVIWQLHEIETNRYTLFKFFSDKVQNRRSENVGKRKRRERRGKKETIAKRDRDINHRKGKDHEETTAMKPHETAADESEQQTLVPFTENLGIELASAETKEKEHENEKYEESLTTNERKMQENVTGSEAYQYSREKSLSEENTIVSTLLAMTLGMLQSRVDMVRLIDGEPCTVQGKNSDVILHVPKGVHGVLLANVHTDHSKFLNHIPDSDCIVSPICEYHLKPSPNKGLNHSESKYTIKIPHIVRDVAKVRKHLRIRHGDIHDQIKALDSAAMDTQDDDTVSCDIDDKYVTVETSHFSGFIVTADGIKCCSDRANIYLFGSLSDIPGVEPLARLRVYLSGKPNEIKDYEDVRVLRYVVTSQLRLDIQTLSGVEEKCKRYFLDKKEIPLSKRIYDPTESEVELTLIPNDSERWKTFMNTQLHVKKKLHEVLKYKEGHICKGNPTEVCNFNLESSRFEAHYFRGILKVKTHLAVKHRCMGFWERIYPKEYSEPVLVELDQRKSNRITFNTWESKEVTDKMLSEISNLVLPKDMREIAIANLGFESSELGTLETECQGNMKKFKFEILNIWKNKNPADTRKKLLVHLYEAASDKGSLDFRDVMKIFGLREYTHET